MDITKIADEVAQDEQGVDIPMLGRDDEPDLASDGTQTTFTVLGRDAKRIRDILDAQTRRLIKARRAQVEPSELYANRVDVACAAVVGWKGVESGGKPVQFTPENVKAVVSHRHILEQVEQGVQAHARFFKTASAS